MFPFLTRLGLPVLCLAAAAAEPLHATAPESIRVATFNTSLNRNHAGELIRDLSTGDNVQAQQIAEIIQRVRPDVLLLNEFDFDAEGDAARLFQENYLAVSQHGAAPLTYLESYTAPVNTGVPSGLDLNHDGRSDGPNDAFGFGRHPGQYGMLVLSQFPIDRDQVRTFQTFLWKDMPGALLPIEPETGKPYYSEEELARFRLSSKSHWDVPLDVNGQPLHLLASHPTPPVFDGPEDRHGRRNHDEIRFWIDYVEPSRGGYIYDDAGRDGGLESADGFVIAGDLNADPRDGDSADGAISQLLEHPLICREPIPASRGAVEAAHREPETNREHRGDPANDTGNFSGQNGPGNLRVDYVLPSRRLVIQDCGVYWPGSEEPQAELATASDHRLVWVDVAWAAE